MRKAQALSLRPGDIITFGFDGQRASTCQLGIVARVTDRGGILVDVLHHQHWTVQVIHRRWLPYHKCALWERAKAYA